MKIEHNHKVVCPTCGRYFEPGLESQKYCSQLCRDRAVVSQVEKDHERHKLIHLKDKHLITKDEFYKELDYLNCRFRHNKCDWCEYPDCVF